ncbi:heparan-alpha-glucosaminide N-acetyltransferase domain-containing protein [Piscinibacter sp. XHJ-5]|uniref:heparan-alpha-glucosaminide N-acetyltransferase domain-containing protein n=1 Tax=Piscinibacter sp. XHJ-5 TaxID=3037797 RepID=UPI002452B279|nr:heparan-alpha-glucosaminide N-acetyltransferase domain-containing protein [Piscinibacter sp. XHJ-5]
MESTLNVQTKRAAAAAAPASTRRERYVDVFRGLLVAHMALDHASLMFNAGRGAEELAAAAPPAAGNLLQFLTRFTGVPVAPAFFFMAGFMVALTSAARGQRGVPDREVTRRLVVRGLVLIAVDALIMGLPRAAMGFFSFAVLSSIGAGLIVLALVRHVPSKVLLPAAVALLALHPLLDVSVWPLALRAILYEPVRTGTLRSLYPVVPWCAILVIGFVVGRDASVRRSPARFWAALAAACLLLFLAVRLPGGYGNAYPYTGVAHLDFWFFAKYPPDLPFLAWSFAATFAGLALVWRLTRTQTPAALRPFELFGRVPFFFYVVHFYVLGVAAALVRAKGGLAATYLVWLLLMAFMAWPCAWYWRKKRERPNVVTRYF